MEHEFFGNVAHQGIHTLLVGGTAEGGYHQRLGFASGEEHGAVGTRQQARFIDSFRQVAPDFQTAKGYMPGRFGEELLTLASKWVANHFSCVSLTLEMPFKDNANLPDGHNGWNGARSKRMGGAMLNAIWRHLAV